MAALLFLAFAYFAFGQAASVRNDAQNAADAAALAAANEARAQIADDLLDSVDDPEGWEDLLAGLRFPNGPSCDEAEKFAAKNSAESDSCVRTALPRTGFTVGVKTVHGVGNSLIPGTGSKHGTATATAVVEPHCDLKEVDESAGLIELTCRGEDVTVDPGDDEPIPDLNTIFSIRLVD